MKPIEDLSQYNTDRYLKYVITFEVVPEWDTYKEAIFSPYRKEMSIVTCSNNTLNAMKAALAFIKFQYTDVNVLKLLHLTAEDFTRQTIHNNSERLS